MNLFPIVFYLWTDYLQLLLLQAPYSKMIRMPNHLKTKNHRIRHLNCLRSLSLDLTLSQRGQQNLLLTQSGCIVLRYLILQQIYLTCSLNSREKTDLELRQSSRQMILWINIRYQNPHLRSFNQQAHLRSFNHRVLLRSKWNQIKNQI